MYKRLIIVFALSLFAAFAFRDYSPSTTQAQQSRQSTTQQQSPAITASSLSAMREYKGVKLGMSREQVKGLMSKSSRDEKNLDEFKLGDGDLMTVHYDDKDAVKTIQLYFTDAKHAPAWKEVIGETEIENKPNGSKFARAVVQEENFWVTMFQSNDGDVTTITISR